MIFGVLHENLQVVGGVTSWGDSGGGWEVFGVIWGTLRWLEVLFLGVVWGGFRVVGGVEFWGGFGGLWGG